MKLLVPIIAVLFISFCTYGEAQHLVFDFVRESEGLNSNKQWSSNAIYIDDYGFVWIVTDRGLNRYDGSEVVSFNGDRVGMRDISYPKLSAIVGDRKGYIWLGTQEEGVIKYNTRYELFEPFESQNYLPDSLKFTQINNLIEDHEGNIIINTAFQGIFKYYLDSDSLRKIEIDHPNNVSNTVGNIMLTRDHQLVIMGVNGLFIGSHEEENTTFDFYPTPYRIWVSNAVELPNGLIKVVMLNQIDYFIIDRSKKTIHLEKNERNLHVSDAFIDSKENLWTSLEGGVFTKEDLNSGHVEEYYVETDIFGKKFPVGMRDMAEDGDGNIYFMSNPTGAGSFNSKAFPFQYAHEKTLFNVKQRNGKTYVIYDDSIGVLQNGVLEPIHLKTTSKDVIYNFEVLPNGNIWVSRYPTLSLTQFDSLGNQIGPTYKERNFTHMQALANGSLSVGASLLDDGPYTFPGSIYEKLSGKEYPDFKAKYYIQDQKGDIWIATFADGIIRITDNQTKFEFMPIDEDGNGKLNSNNPYYIYESNDGTVFVCTDKGINIWDPKTETFSYLQSLGVGRLIDVKGMVEDRKGNIWIALLEKICKFDIEDQQITEYNLHPDFHIERAESQDLHIDEDGNILYAAQYNVVTFNPEELAKPNPPKDVIFTDLYINRSKVYPADSSGVLDSSLFAQSSFTLPYEKRDVGFKFVSPMGDRVSATYFYRLKGYKDSWETVPDSRPIHFTSLNPGKYTMQVKAKSGGGEWTKNVTEVEFRISPPWYMTWWAYCSYFLAISAFAYGFYAYRVNQLLKYQALRTKISSDLHDDVGSILGSIAMESEMLSFSKETELTEELSRLSALSRDAMGRMRDTVWAIDSRKDEVGFLADRMKDYLSETLRNSTFEFKFSDESGAERKAISPDVRQNVYLIFKEAINNILKHSNGDLVEVSFTRSGNRFRLSIEDNGSLVEELHTSGLGLTNMEMRANNIGAELEVVRKDGFKILLTF